MQLKCALEVTGLVLVDDVVLGQLVQHGGNFRQQGLGSALFRRVAQRLHGIAGCLGIKPVMGTLGDRLANPFLG